MARSWLDYKTQAWVQWCPGCGDFGILNSIYRAVSELGIDPENLAVVGGIGCSGRTTYYVKGSNFHALHGRAIPVATGVKLANPHLNVIVAGGDGDLMGIGGGHFVALGRRNLNITVLLFDNAVYGLTKGQAAPTLPAWVKTKALSMPNIHDNINPVLLAFAAGYTFIARGYAYHTQQLKELIKTAVRHRGAALVDILQPCPTYNNIMTNKWYEERIYYVDQEEGYDPIIRTPEEFQKKAPAIAAKLMEFGDRIPLGILYWNQTRESFEERLEKIMPGYMSAPPATRRIELEGKPFLHPFDIFKDRLVTP
ncbi:2-oxoacid:ferredoxin oxidoreductase beta subunit [Aeropyrum pernix K1]|uniref:2-oxoacid:ferredoxin oxidoreductase 2, subunit beta n=1 Tax=Aeropyrum pernix (strain ATCC 700893 / DSM 11879 / JCM 9820 / NBRC 100138 / K1) TaxID=272557 RepID=OFOB2_AERPE|nr:2-oxoacid:ferredoxin oxidoreductase subunit beta [Aeropyrum pernix]Q9YBX8.1 RecName: Full=2-oxoacid:ferredoxin oxidoreductase 2, subunit beta; Short=OFOR2 [Aeropyrum pernix K1]BAA80470.1 2-oxoacid:ferredoxin oxidoreductase beta subunit [Aeropyrum pernix K1]